MKTVSLASFAAPSFTCAYAHNYRKDNPDAIHTICGRPMPEYGETNYIGTVENEEGMRRDIYAGAPTQWDKDNGANVSIVHPMAHQRIQKMDAGGIHPYAANIRPGKLVGKKLFVYESREDDKIVWVPYIHKSL